jgi:hypothetical protein
MACAMLAKRTRSELTRDVRGVIRDRCPALVGDAKGGRQFNEPADPVDEFHRGKAVTVG